MILLFSNSFSFVSNSRKKLALNSPDQDTADTGCNLCLTYSTVIKKKITLAVLSIRILNIPEKVASLNKDKSSS